MSPIHLQHFLVHACLTSKHAPVSLLKTILKFSEVWTCFTKYAIEYAAHAHAHAHMLNTS